MQEDDILNDILKDRIMNQRCYNNNVINDRNPELMCMFSEAREDETRDIVKIQQKLSRLRYDLDQQTDNSSFINKIFSD